MKNQITIAMIAMFIAAVSCKKDSGGSADNNTNDTIAKPKVVLEDTLCRGWIVTKSTHNGDPDPGTVGLNLEFYQDGSYKLVTTGYMGTWEFLDDKSKILIDKGSKDFETTWTIQKLTAKLFIVTFISPFTGGSVYWELEPF